MPEPYHGDLMVQCLLKPFDFQHTTVYGRPKFMREQGYKRYLKENGKRELRRSVINIPNPAAAHRKLEELLATQWPWAVLPHNCAGGSNAGLYFNCPSLKTFK